MTTAPRSAARAGSWLPVFALSLGVLVSALGDKVVALGLVLDGANHSSHWGVAGVYLADLLPPIAFAPLLGVLTDHWDARRACVAALTIQGVLFLGLAPIDNFAVRVVAIALSSVVGVVAGAAGFKLIPLVARDNRLSRANSIIGAGSSVAAFLAPALGGLVISGLGISWLFAADGVTFLAFAVAALISTQGVPATDVVGLPRRPFAEVGNGLRVLLDDQVLKRAVPLLAGIMVGTSLEGVASIFYLRGVALGSTTLVGLMLAVWALGSIPGSYVGGLRKAEGRELTLVVAGAAGISAGILGAGLWPVVAAVCTCFLIGGFSNGLHNVGVRTLIHRRVPPERQGQAWSFFSALVGGCVGAGYLLGTLTAVVPSRAIVIASGAGPMVVVVLSAILLRSTTASGSRTAQDDMSVLGSRHFTGKR